MRGLEVVQNTVLMWRLARHVRIVCTCDDDHGIVVGHAIPQILAHVAFNLISRSPQLTRVLVSDLAPTCARDDHIAVDVIARVGHFVEHEATYEAADGVAGALIATEVVQSFA